MRNNVIHIWISTAHTWQLSSVFGFCKKKFFFNCKTVLFIMSLPVISQDFEERVLRSTSPSLLSATVGQRLLTRLDDGSGCTSPDSVITLWTEEGIHNSRDILQVRTGFVWIFCFVAVFFTKTVKFCFSRNFIVQATLLNLFYRSHLKTFTQP